eukprot:332067-Amphidinium_carterae.1
MAVTKRSDPQGDDSIEVQLPSPCKHSSLSRYKTRPTCCTPQTLLCQPAQQKDAEAESRSCKKPKTNRLKFKRLCMLSTCRTVRKLVAPTRQAQARPRRLALRCKHLLLVHCGESWLQRSTSGRRIQGL